MDNNGKAKYPYDEITMKLLYSDAEDCDNVSSLFRYKQNRIGRMYQRQGLHTIGA